MNTTLEFRTSQTRNHAPLLWLLAIFSLSACGTQQAANPVPATSVANPPAETSQADAEETEAYANALMASALKTEPDLSPVLMTLAKSAGGEMWGFKYRFKSKKSLLRKINKLLLENPGKVVEDIRINDALRYTILIDDEPRGNYTDTLHRALEEMEALGHRVEQVKNYWPTGDNYSGVNCVLITPAGLLWELQFHTRQSKTTNNENRAMYEELRLVTTPLKRKKVLFRKMTEAWDSVSIPSSVLEDKSLHEKEAIITRDSP